MTEPPDRAAAGHGWLPAGQSDREQVIEALKDAFVHGRLTRGELDLRVGPHGTDHLPGRDQQQRPGRRPRR